MRELAVPIERFARSRVFFRDLLSVAYLISIITVKRRCNTPGLLGERPGPNGGRHRLNILSGGSTDGTLEIIEEYRHKLPELFLSLTMAFMMP